MNDTRPPVIGIEILRATAAWHEQLLTTLTDAADNLDGTDGTDGHAGADRVLAALLMLHAPFLPPVDLCVGNPLFRADDPRPVCRGCDRIQHTVSRDPAWPCRTYQALTEHVLTMPAAQHLAATYPAPPTPIGAPSRRTRGTGAPHLTLAGRRP